MKLILLNQDGEVVQKEGVDLDDFTAKQLVDAALSAKFLAETLGERFFYLKLEMKGEAVILGFDGENVLAIFASTPAEVVEATARFSHNV